MTHQVEYRDGAIYWGEKRLRGFPSVETDRGVVGLTPGDVDCRRLAEAQTTARPFDIFQPHCPSACLTELEEEKIYSFINWSDQGLTIDIEPSVGSAALFDFFTGQAVERLETCNKVILSPHGSCALVVKQAGINHPLLFK